MDSKKQKKDGAADPKTAGLKKQALIKGAEKSAASLKKGLKKARKAVKKGIRKIVPSKFKTTGTHKAGPKADIPKAVRSSFKTSPKKLKTKKAPIGRGGGRKMSKQERNAEVFKQRLIIGIIALLLISWCMRGFYYLRHFQRNTTVNGVDVSMLTYKKASEKLKEQIPKWYQLEILGPDEKTEVISGTGLGLEIVSTKGVKTALRKQKSFSWITENLKEKSYEVDLETSFLPDELENVISMLDMLDETKMVTPVNAQLVEGDNGHYSIKKEVVGSKIRTQEAHDAIVAAVANGRDELDLTQYQEFPEVTSDNESLNKRLNQWNHFMEAEGLTYKVCESTVVFDGPTIARLLTDNGTDVELDKQKIKDLVAEWAYYNNTYDAQFDFTTYYGKVVTIDPYGTYGYEIDDEELPDELYDKISNGDTGSYEVSYYHKPLYDFNNGLGGNYVEINIDKQHLWVWKDGEVVVDSPIVSGLPVYGQTTYYGCYAINLMQEHAVLGDVNVEGYESEVRYWVRFNSGEGIHDADWRDKFGGQIWIYAGSHGCVNIPVDIMPDIYANVEVGEAVVVYGHDYDPSVWDPSTKTVNTAYYEQYYDELAQAESGE